MRAASYIMIIFPDHFILSTLDFCQTTGRFNTKISQKVNLSTQEVSRVLASEVFFFDHFEEL